MYEVYNTKLDAAEKHRIEMLEIFPGTCMTCLAIKVKDTLGIDSLSPRH